MVADASGGTSADAHKYAMDRMVQAASFRVTWQQVLLEWQRDWARKKTYDATMATVKEHSGAYGRDYPTSLQQAPRAPRRAAPPRPGRRRPFRASRPPSASPSLTFPPSPPNASFFPADAVEGMVGDEQDARAILADDLLGLRVGLPVRLEIARFLRPRSRGRT